VVWYISFTRFYLAASLLRKSFSCDGIVTSLFINLQGLSQVLAQLYSCASGRLLRWWSTSHHVFCTTIYELSNTRNGFFYSKFFSRQLVYLSDPGNGILVLLSTMVLRWATLLFLTSYLDEFSCLQNGISKLLIASRPDRNHQTLKKLSTQPQEFQASIEIDITYILREAQPRPFYLYVFSSVGRRAWKRGCRYCSAFTHIHKMQFCAHRP
jgi:hypothetical protein